MITEVYKGAPNTPELYVPQRHMLEAVEDAREAGISECYVDVATGVGKTYAVAHDIKKYLYKKPDARVLYLCHKGQVLEQARNTISDVVGPEVSHGNFYKNQYEDQEQMTYATFQQMGGRSDEGKNYHAFNPKEFDYIVVDEGHHGPAPTYTEVIEYFEPAFQIGLTATDERMDGKDISEVLGPKVFEYTLEEAIAESVLVKPDYRLFTEHEADLKDLLEDEDMPPTLKEINDRLTRVQRDKNYQQAIVGEIQAAQAENMDPRTVIYCPDIQYADEFSGLIPEGQALHSGLSEEEQDERLRAFRTGELPTLLVVDIFNEGIDVPEINTMVFLRGTESKTIFLQQLGRGLRTAEGKEKVIALDFAASWQRIMLIAELKDKVQTIYQGQRPYSKNGDGYKNSRSERQYFESEKMVPFDFSFSKDALDAVNIVEKIRREKTKLKQVNKKDGWLEKWKNADKALEAMFGLKPFDPQDPDNPHNLPIQRLTQAQEDSYARKIALGDKNAQEQYIMHRLRYVYNRALTEHGKQVAAGSLDLEDYFQKGLEELTILLDKYDTDTYKKHPDLRRYMAIKLWSGLQKVSQYESTQIRIPIHIQEKVKKIQHAQELYMKKSKTGAIPLDTELAELLEDDLSIADIEYLRSWADMFENGFDGIEKLSMLQAEGEGVVEEVSTNIAEDKMAIMLEGLSLQERRVLIDRYGIGTGAPRTQEAVANDLGVTGSRVGAIESATVERLYKDPMSIEVRDAFIGIDTPEEYLAQNFPNIMPARSARERSIIHQLYDAYAKLHKSQTPDVWEEIRTLEGHLRYERKEQEDRSKEPQLRSISLKGSEKQYALRVEKREKFWKELMLENAPEHVASRIMTHIESLEMLEGLSESLRHARKLIELMNAKGPSSHWEVKGSKKDLTTLVSIIETEISYLKDSHKPMPTQLFQLRSIISKLNGSILRAEYSLSNINKY